MTPKIRGVARPMRRFTKPNAGVKKVQMSNKESDSGAKMLQKGYKANAALAKRLQKGEFVDVRLEEDGLHGSWHSAVICGVKPGLRHVKFKTLTGDNNAPVREWVRFGTEGLGTKFPLGTRKVSDNRPVLRPGGPGLPPFEPSFRKTGGWPKDLWVEVFSEEAWWEGVLLEDISSAQMCEEDSVVDVIFPQLNDIIEQVALKNLRECKDWNVETGFWTIRGRRVKEGDPTPAILAKPRNPASECVAVKEHRGNRNGRNKETSLQNEELDKLGDTGAETLRASARGSLPSVGLVSSVQQNTGFGKAFGRLIEVVEKEKHFILRVQTLEYTLEQMQVSVKEGCLFLDASSNSSEEKLGSFTCKVYSVCSSILGLPTDVAIDHEDISWDLHGEVLTVTVPRTGEGAMEVDRLSS